jgi:hypothetical protein
MKRALLFATALLPLMALKNDPWIPPPFEFSADAKYNFSYFSSVANAVNPENYSSYVNNLNLELNLSVSPEIFVETEVEFDNSKKVDFNLLSVAPAVKYQFLNDLTGDMVALVVGAYFRYVPENRLIDVATPYSGEFNFDFLISVGKEFDRNEKPLGNLYAMLDFGIATIGAPWILADITGEAIFKQKHFFKMGIDGFFGFGSQSTVNIDDFYGYAKIYHQSLDIKLGYTYKLDVWGDLSLVYKGRVLATAYPDAYNLFGVEYKISFSF